MMKKLILFIMAVTAWCTVSHASGVMQLYGTIKAFTPDLIDVSDDRHVYSIDKKFVPEDVKKMKTGAKVALNVPFTAIKSVRKISK